MEAVRKDQVKLNLKLRNPDFYFYEGFNVYYDPVERFPNEAQNGIWAGPGITKMIQDHMMLNEEYPHRSVNSYYRDFDTSFDPEPTPQYTPQASVCAHTAYFAFPSKRVVSTC